MLRSLSIAAALIGGLGLSPHALCNDDKSGSKTLKLEGGAKSPSAKIADIAWLAGRWISEGLGGTVEEVWSPPLGDSMMGMFRLVKNGKVVFSEHCFISEVEGSLVLKIKHFDAGLKGWEEKDASVRFALVKLAPSAAYFDGLTIKRSGADALTMYVAVKNKKTGAVREEEFRYRRAKDA